MAAGKTSQPNTSLVALIVFIILFLACAVMAFVFYTKFEDEKALKLAAEQTAEKLANRTEQSALDSKIVGKVKSGKSYIATMTGYVDEMVQAITGNTSEATAATKINEAKIQINEAVETLGQDATAVFGQEDFNLINTITTLKTKLDMTRNQSVQLGSQIKELENNIDITLKEHQKEIDDLIAKVDKADTERNAVLSEYNLLKDMMTKSVDDQIQSWQDKLEIVEEQRKEQNIEIADLNDQIQELTERLKETLNKLEGIKSSPDNEVMAYAADAIVHTADIQNGLIYLNKGLKDRIYVGLTFSVFDRNAPIPEDGKGKGEIEVFRVEQNSCVAKVLSSSRKDPIIADDIAVNMIWDSKENNSFLVIGDFDFDGDQLNDRDGKEKIVELIKQWGGKIVDELTVNTDFLVVGTRPKPLRKPSRQEMEDNPYLEEKYENSLQKARDYANILDKARTFLVPVFNRDRFLRLIGYETIAAKSSPSYSTK